MSGKRGERERGGEFRCSCWLISLAVFFFCFSSPFPFLPSLRNQLLREHLPVEAVVSGPWIQDWLRDKISNPYLDLGLDDPRAPDKDEDIEDEAALKKIHTRVRQAGFCGEGTRPGDKSLDPSSSQSFVQSACLLQAAKRDPRGFSFTRLLSEVEAPVCRFGIEYPLQHILGLEVGGALHSKEKFYAGSLWKVGLLLHGEGRGGAGRVVCGFSC